MELPELAIGLSAEVEPVQSCGQRIAGETVDDVPAGVEHHAVDRYAFVIKRIAVFGRERDDVNVVTEACECSGDTIEVVGQAAIEVVFSNEFRCGECDAQVS